MISIAIGFAYQPDTEMLNTWTSYYHPDGKSLKIRLWHVLNVLFWLFEKAIIDPTKSIKLIEYIWDESNIEVNFKQYTATPKI